jgi:hypothetical protein
MKNAHYRTWNMARKLKNMEKETQTLLDLEYDKKKTIKSMENEKCALEDLEYGKKH